MASIADSENDNSRLLKSTFVTGSMTVLSRVSGLARDIGFSRWFGAEPVMDAFFVAFKIPNLLRRFFAEGAFSQAFVPVISEYRATRSTAEARDLVDRTAGTLGLILFAVTLVGVTTAPLLIYIFAPGFSGADERHVLAGGMLRLTFPYLFFISLTALAGAILNTYRKFAVPAFTPVLLNVVLILFAGWVAPHFPNPGLGLALGVFAAGFTQLAFQLPFLVRLGLLPRPRWDWAHEGVRRILRLMAPVMLGSSVAQINILLDTLIASFLAAGSISWLYYSDRLVEFPLGVFGIALATVIMPSLSEHHARDSTQVFSQTLDWALRLVLIIGLPAAVGLVMLAKPMLTTLFFGGAFTAFDVAMAGASLKAFAPGLIGFILVKVLSPGYFARQDTRTPVRIAIKALVFGMALNIVFVVTLLETGWAPPHAGLAAATSLSAFFNASLLLAGLLRSGVYRFEPGWPRFAARVVVASATMALFVELMLDRLGDWLTFSTWERIGALAAIVLAAIVVYLLACLVVGLRPSQFYSRAAD
jgi:putative peptidoglycan lipid II flippase